jgi:hypothetical protein
MPKSVAASQMANTYRTQARRPYDHLICSTDYFAAPRRTETIRK